MKKRIMAVVAALVLVFGAFGCGGILDKYDNCISELRDNVYAASAEGMEVDIVSGRREKPFAVDGVVNAKTDFTVITVMPAEFVPNATYNYEIEIDGQSFNGIMTMHPFGDSYSVELPVRAAQPSLSLKLKQGGKETVLQADNVSGENAIDAAKALEVAVKALSEKLRPWKKSGGYDCEIYIRIIANPINADGGYFWYVAFLNKDTYAALIDLNTAEVVGIKD